MHYNSYIFTLNVYGVVLPVPRSLVGCSALAAAHNPVSNVEGENPLSQVVDAAVKASPVESRWWVPPDCCRQQSVAVGRIPALFCVMPNGSLNARQEAFVKKLAEGASQRAAYLAAGYAARGDNVAEAAASRLFKNVKVQLRLAELRANTAKRHAELQAKIAVRHEITVDTIIAQLEEARQAALTCNPRQTGAAVAATMGLAKLLGLIVDRSEAHVVHHKPAPLPTALVELSEEEWIAQFDPSHGRPLIEHQAAAAEDDPDNSSTWPAVFNTDDADRDQ